MSAAGGSNQCRAWSGGLQAARRLVRPGVVGFAGARVIPGLQLLTALRGVPSVSQEAKPQWQLR